MAILSTIKKGYLFIKTATGYVKLLPRTLATLVSMADGTTVESQITTLKNDVTTLNSKLENKISGFGTTESIALPYTAKSDGILQIYATAKASGGAYYYIRIGGRITRLQIQNGGVTSASFPVRKGEEVKIEETNNIGTVTLTYFLFL